MFGLTPQRRERAAMPLERLRQEFASLFDRAFGWAVPWETMEPYGFEMEDKGPEVVVRAEMPGFEIGEIDVRLAGNVLTIVAEHKEKAEGKEKEPVERAYGRLERTVTLPEGVEPAKVEAHYRNGVLEVHLPKAPGLQPRRIEVKA
jgi:HSP20 family protein